MPTMQSIKESLDKEGYVCEWTKVIVVPVVVNEVIPVEVRAIDKNERVKSPLSSLVGRITLPLGHHLSRISANRFNLVHFNSHISNLRIFHLASQDSTKQNRPIMWEFDISTTVEDSVVERVVWDVANTIKCLQQSSDILKSVDTALQAMVDNLNNCGILLSHPSEEMEEDGKEEDKKLKNSGNKFSSKQWSANELDMVERIVSVDRNNLVSAYNMAVQSSVLKLNAKRLGDMLFFQKRNHEALARVHSAIRSVDQLMIGIPKENLLSRISRCCHHHTIYRLERASQMMQIEIGNPHMVFDDMREMCERINKLNYFDDDDDDENDFDYQD